jgi:glycosyltransferase involved in cell wall biosynthesis
MRVLVVVPAPNEATSVAGVVAELRALGDPNLEIVVVDDGSRDATASAAAGAGARVLRMPFNVGIGGAVQAGYQLAHAEGHDVVVQIDGDGQHPGDQVPILLERIRSGSANYVIGSRFIDGDYRPSRARQGGITLLSKLISMLVGYRVTDTTSGMRAADRRAIEIFAREYPADYPEAEAIVVADRNGLTVAEVPVQMRPRAAGRSSITPLRSIYYMLKVSLAVLVRCIGRNPARTEPGAA